MVLTTTELIILMARVKQMIDEESDPTLVKIYLDSYQGYCDELKKRGE